MSISKTINKVAKFFWQNGIKGDRNQNHLIINSLYCLLTYYGSKESKNIIPSIGSISSMELRELAEFAVRSEAYPKEPLQFQKLDKTDIPKYRSEILEALTASQILEKFFMILINNRFESKYLPILCAIVLTYSFRILGIVPKVDIDMCFLSISASIISEQDIVESFESQNIILDFLDSSTNYLECAAFPEDVLQIFGWHLLRQHKNQLGPLIDKQIDAFLLGAEPLLFEKLMEFTFSRTYATLRKKDENYFLAVQNFLLALQTIVNITSQRTIGAPVALFLYLHRFSAGTSLFSIIDQIPKLIPRFERKVGAIILAIKENVNYFCKPANISKNGLIGNKDFMDKTGINSPYPDKQYILDLLSSNLYVPRMVVSFNTIESYSVASFILFKESFTLDLWDDIRMCLNEDSHAAGKLIKAKIEYKDNYIAFQCNVDIDDERVIFMEIKNDEVLSFCFAQVNTKETYVGAGNMHFHKSKLLFGSSSPRYNYVYVMDPRTFTNQQMLLNAVEIYQNSDMISQTLLGRIWLGPDDQHPISKLQQSIDTDMIPFTVDSGGAISDPVSLMEALVIGRKRMGMVSALRTGKNLMSEARLRIPSDLRDSVRIIFKKSFTCIPGNSFKLTTEQQLAVLSSIFYAVTVIQGPPGTGKTETMLAIARVLYHNLPIVGSPFRIWSDPEYEVEEEIEEIERTRILICAHSNAALDQMICTLADTGIDVFRYGKSPTSAQALKLTVEGRIQSELQLVYEIIDNELKRNDQLELDESCIDKISDILSFDTCTDISDGIDLYYDDLVNFAEDLGKIDSKNIKIASEKLKFCTSKIGRITSHYLENIGIIGSTISSTALRIDDFRSLNVDTIIIEEAAKVLETEMLSFLLLNPSRFILIGDQEQLTPIIKSDDVRLIGRFNISLFERFQTAGISAIQLTAQGRAKTEIADIYRDRYGEPLKDLPSVSRLPSPKMIDVPAQWIDVIGLAQPAPMQNKEEADAIVGALGLFRKQGLDLNSVSVLSPYKNQKEFLIQRLKEEEEIYPRDICTVDEFQGLQNIVIIVSMVSKSPSVWLRDARRINVLVSRARSALIIFGNKRGFEESYEWANIIQRINKCRSAGKLYACSREFSASNLSKL